MGKERTELDCSRQKTLRFAKTNLEEWGGTKNDGVSFGKQFRTKQPSTTPKLYQKVDEA